MMHVRPAVRERMILQQARYCTDEWLRDYAVNGFRFLWPFQPEAAFVWDQSKFMLQASPEFLLRVRSLRSFTLTKDFLDRYPDFRGEAPQLEPSATIHQPSLTDTMERSYWAALRRKRVNRKKTSPRLRTGKDRSIEVVRTESLPQVDDSGSSTLCNCQRAGLGRDVISVD